MTRNSHRRHPQDGFTLIELLIVVVVLSILAAIAMPQYRDYVVRSNRTVAKNLLVQVADRQEQFYAANKRYAADLTDLGYPGATSFVVGKGSETAASDSGAALYSIALSGATNTTYTLTATRLNTQTDDTKCTAFMIDHTGRRWSSPDGSECW